MHMFKPLEYSPLTWSTSTCLFLASVTLLSTSLFYPVSAHAADVWSLEASGNIYTSYNGNVGIGKTEPGQKLVVQKTGSGVATFNDGDSGPCCAAYYTVSINEVGPNNPTLQFHDGLVGEGQMILAQNVANNGRGFVFQSTQAPMNGKFTGSLQVDQKLGVGTSSPSAKLDVVDSNNANLRLTKDGVNSFNIYNDGQANIRAPQNLYITTGDNGQYATLLYNTQVSIRNAADQEKAKISTDNSSSFINSGNFGVGTTTPTEKLEVNGNLKATGLVLPTNAQNGYVLTSDAAGNATWKPAPTSNTTVSSSNYWAANGTAVYNTNSNLIGIGTTSPADKLEVVGDIRATSQTPQLKLWDTDGWKFGIKSDSDRLQFHKYDAAGNWQGEMASFTKDGNMGIGTVTPRTKLEVNGNITNSGSDFILGNNDGRDQGLKTGNRALVHETGDKLVVNYGGDFEGGVLLSGPLRVEGSETVLATQKVISDGFVGIGKNPGAALDVNGDIRLENGKIQSVGEVVIRPDIDNSGDRTLRVEGQTYIQGGLKVENELRAQKIRVMSDVNADYVFRPGYRLMSLPELEQYIKENGHLPGVPDDKEVFANGIDMSKGYVTLLEKVEELTLHTIEQQKQIDELKTQVKNQENK
jgi:hypothetical protein